LAAALAELLRLHREGPMSGAATDGPNNWAERNSLTCPPVPETAVIMGDFNFEPSHPEYALMTGEVDPIYGRITTRDGFADAWVRAGHGEDEGVRRCSTSSDRRCRARPWSGVTSYIAKISPFLS